MNDLEPTPVIVFADRDPTSLESMSGQVARWGYEAICARDLVQLNQWLGASPADLIVMDLQFEGEDSLAVVRRMLEHPACPPIVVLNGQTVASTRQ